MSTAREHMPEPWRRRLYLPAYGVSEAARYAGTSPQTITRWHYGAVGRKPLLPGRERRQPLSYLELVEVAFVATFRGLGVSLRRIAQAREFLAKHFRAEYPLAHEGHHILMELQQADPDASVDSLIVLDRNGQLGWKSVISDRYYQFDYEYGLALRWHVASRESPVIIDPRISFGAPMVRGIATWALAGRYGAGESIEDLEEDFNLTEEEIRAALRFEGLPAAA